MLCERPQQRSVGWLIVVHKDVESYLLIVHHQPEDEHFGVGEIVALG